MRHVRMPNLKRLQLFMNDNRHLSEDYMRGELWLQFCPYRTPSLEVLEVEVQCSLGILIDPKLTLKSLVLIAAGTLQIRGLRPYVELRSSHEEVAHTAVVSQLYLRSGAALQPRYKQALQEALKLADTGQPGAWPRLLEHISEEKNSWTAQIPASFHPGDLQECCCGACPACLVRAGVPILFDQAWTRDGFDQHMRPPGRCSTAAPH